VKNFLLQDGDIVLINNDVQLVVDNTEIIKRIEFILNVAKGEWFLNPSVGMDREPIFSKIFNDTRARDSIIESVGQVEEVETVDNIIFIRIDRTLLVTMDITLKTGDTLQNVEVNIV